MELGKIGAFLAASFAVGVWCTSASALTLKVSDSHNDTHSTVVALKEMSTSVKERTNGDITIQVFGNGVLGTESEMINQLRTGILDMVRTAPTDLEKFNRSIAPFLPALFVQE